MKQGLTVAIIVILLAVPLASALTASPARASGSATCPAGASYDTSTSAGELSICTVIGQPDLTTLVAGKPATPTDIGNPTAVAFDSKGNLWVVDNYNNRVLEYSLPFSTGEAASLVIGQTSLTGSSDSTPAGGLYGPTDIAFDSKGNLWVVDSGNNRVLEFKSPFSNGESASLVIGQPTFGGYIGMTTSGGLNSPSYLAFDPSGNLWVTDQGNNRVLEFPYPFSTGEKASVVMGQADFTSFAPASTAANSLFEPLGLGFDSSGNLWVVDSADHRVLEYNPPLSTDEDASIVIGQPTLTTDSSTNLNGYDIAFDPSGNLWVSDGISGVAEYTAPLTTGESGSQMIGPKTVTGSGTSPGMKLSDPQGISFDSGGNLWVADYGHGRVLEFGTGTAPTTSSSCSSTTASGTLGGGIYYNSSASSSTTASGTLGGGIYYDKSASPSVTTSGTLGGGIYYNSSTTASGTLGGGIYYNSSASPSATTSSCSSTTASGTTGGVPVFPYQFAMATLFTILMAASYLFIRRRTRPRNHGGSNVTLT